LGKGGYEGIHPDNRGNILIIEIEDVGGTSVNVNPQNPQSPKAARQPNSFVYRFVPYDKTDLTKGGKLQALQVKIHGHPVTFHANDPVGDTFSQAQLKLHRPGSSWPVRWVTVHDTATNGSAPFDANAALPWQQVPHPSSVQKMLSSFLVQTSRRSFSIQRETLTPILGINLSWRLVVPGAQSSGSI